MTTAGNPVLNGEIDMFLEASLAARLKGVEGNVADLD